MDMDRIVGVLTLKAPTYRQIADDPNATTPAGIIVVLASLVSGFFAGLVSFDTTTNTSSANFTSAIVVAIVTVIFGLIGWFISAWVLAFVAKWFGGKTNTQEMLRVTGFVNLFTFVGVLNVLALITPVLGCVTGLIGFVAAILRLIGFVIGVREAGEFSTGNAVITAIVAAIVNFIILAIGTSIVAILGFGAAAALGK